MARAMLTCESQQFKACHLCLLRGVKLEKRLTVAAQSGGTPGATVSVESSISNAVDSQECLIDHHKQHGSVLLAASCRQPAASSAGAGSSRVVAAATSFQLDAYNEDIHLQPLSPQLEQHEQLHGVYIPQQIARWMRNTAAVLKANWRYERLTALLAAASVVPALVLAVQPLLAGAGANDPAVAATAAAVTQAVEWQGPLRDMFSFTVLLSVFISCEPGAAAASAVSAAGAGLALVSGAGRLPLVACCTAAALAASATLVLAAAARMHAAAAAAAAAPTQTQQQQAPEHSSSSSNSAARWDWNQPDLIVRRVQEVLGTLGGGLLVQYICSLASSGPSNLPTSTAAAAVEWLLPVAGGAAAVLLLGKLVASVHDKQLLLLWEDWPAWSATLLLILQPLQQLVESSLQPMQLLPDISTSQQLLLVLSSGLMVPRALLLNELMWFTGTCSGAALAAAQLLVLGAHRLAQQCAVLSSCCSCSSAGSAAAGQVLSLQLQLQQWAIAAGVPDPSCRTAVTVTALSLALMATCMVLQAGWMKMESQ